MNKVTETEALKRVYETLNGPVTYGRKYVKYTKEQVEASMDVLKQILANRGVVRGNGEE